MAGSDAIGSLTTFRRDDTRADAGGAVRGAILFDDARIRQPSEAWFDPSHWGRHARPVSVGGRGSAWFVEGPFGDAVLRHYRRGGMAARISRDQYLWQGESRVRSFAEYRLMARLRKLGLPVPCPLAACYWREGMRYRAAILLERLHDVRTFAELVEQHPEAAPWEETGALIARFHSAGLDHADLNANNILFDGAGGWLIDFDRGQLRRPGATWRENNLARLLRSLQKLRGLRKRSDVEQDFVRLHDAYERAMEQAA